MGTIFDHREEEKERLRRSNERKERMRREKQLQAKRRRMRKLFIRIAARLSLILIVVLLVGTVIWKGGQALFSREAKAKTEMEAEESKAGDGQIAEAVGEKGEEEASPPEGQMEMTEEPAVVVNASGAITAEMAPYSFASTGETKGIYSEEVVSTHAILVDESTNTIVAKKGAEDRISPASMTKVLTILVAAERLTLADLNDTFTMTREITDYGYVNDCSVVGFLDGETVTVRDLFYGTVLPSGADAALGLAIYVAGSHEAFVELMNEKLEQLGLSDSAHFTNCVGLYDEYHYCTVYDMAVIMKAALQNVLCREVLSAHTYTTSATTEHPEGISISNWFLRRIEDKDTGGYVFCAKTGYVVQSGSCAVSYGIFADGKPYICVTADSTTSWRCIYDHVEIYNQYIKA
ncbi:MAG: D-alanyl-D-alanine carboxypeptidase [Lachnospiraceae bacterium]|nr:D-alanyl-D-alanine carboxypeptidase [Lachnospiraceae bacterium]